MSGTDLERILRDLVRFLGGHFSQVMLRTYTMGRSQTEAGEPPKTSYTEEPIIPNPIVLSQGDGKATGLKELEVFSRAETGHKIVIMPAGCSATLGSSLVIDGDEYEIVRIQEPVVFKRNILKVALARKVIK